MSIILTDKQGNYPLNGDCLLHKYNNVVSYKYSNCKSELTINVDNTKAQSNNEIEIYFIFDCPGEEALFHWVGESFIFYPLLLQLQSIYPNIKIFSKNTKKYVKNLFKFFNISNEVVNTFQNTNNICFFPPILSLNDMDSNIELYKSYLQLYITDINSRLSSVTIPNNRVLLLPRNNKDNYSANDRKLLGIEDIEENVISIGGVVLNTYQINNIELQWSIIKNSEIIILDMGSSFFFNCLWLSNKTIILLDNYGISWQINSFIALNILYNIINTNNKLYIIPSNNNNKITFNDIKQHIINDAN
jgi:hypothetical protein